MKRRIIITGGAKGIGLEISKIALNRGYEVGIIDNDKTAVKLAKEQNQIKQLITDNEHLDSLWIVGHSFGGLIVSLFSESWNEQFPITVHSVAAPLNSTTREIEKCKPLNRSKYDIVKNINYFQWRTLHLQDGAFKKLEYDPQEITINNGKTILLPKEWDGGRLGHNRSILFVSGLIID